MQGRHQTGCISDRVRVADRPRGGVVGRPEHRGHADAGGGGQVHRARIVGHQPARAADDPGERRQVGPADQIDDRVAAARARRGSRRPVAASAALPIITHRTPSIASESASSAKYAGGQRLAPPYAAPGASATSGARPSHPPSASSRAARVARVVRHGDARLARTVRKSQRVHQLLVVLDLVQSPRPADRPASADRRASPRGSPSARECRRAPTTSAERKEFGNSSAVSNCRSASSAPSDRQRGQVADRRGAGQHDDVVHLGDELKQRRDGGPRRNGDRRAGRLDAARRRSPAAP